MTAKFSVCFLTVILAGPHLPADETPPLPTEKSEWDKLVDRYIETYRAIKDRKPVAFPEMGDRIHTLFRSHTLNHVKIFIQKDGDKKQLATDLYYGKGELHVVQHIEGWNLVTKGDEAFEWKFGRRTGDNSPSEAKELIAYTIYLTDPAFFPTSLYGDYLRKPDQFETPVPGNAGCTKLRPKEPYGGFTEVQVDLKRIWYGEFEFLHGKSGEATRWIFSMPKAIEKIPDEVFDRMKRIRFRKGKKLLRRHRVYL
jgi:hypothetical protein